VHWTVSGKIIETFLNPPTTSALSLTGNLKPSRHEYNVSGIKFGAYMTSIKGMNNLKISRAAMRKGCI